MSHMIADTEEELHAMAAKIGVARSWFQPGGGGHYDVSMSKRELAIREGAKAITLRELAGIIRRTRGKRLGEGGW
jgi:hypothetical protein